MYFIKKDFIKKNVYTFGRVFKEFHQLLKLIKVVGYFLEIIQSDHE